MDSISILIKPASSKCNLKCKYCFYLDSSSYRYTADFGIMDFETVDNIIKQIVSLNPKHINIGFQGGEPLLAGSDYFEYFIDKFNAANTNNIRVSYMLQTNGTIINDKFIKIFKENNFLIGLSIDGPMKLHDKNRILVNDEKTHTKVLETLQIFKDNNIAFNVLCVVTKDHAKNAEKVYNYFKKLNLKYLQFIPCLDPVDSKKQNYSLSSDDYFMFLDETYKLWLKDLKDNNPVSIRYFDNMVWLLKGKLPESCDMRGICSIQNIIEADGSVYPCDFYCFDDKKIGNINENSFEQMFNHEISQEFINSSKVLNDKCRTCPYINLCRGGCTRMRDTNKLNVFCGSYYKFFNKHLESLKTISKI